MIRWLACLVLVVLTGAAGLPVVIAILFPGAQPEGATPVGIAALALDRVVLTVLLAALIGLLGSALAWPVALATRGLGGRWLTLCVLPLFVPVYLVPGAWRTLLDPSSSIGSWLLRRSLQGEVNLLQLVDQLLAIIGLSIWVSPIAWIILHLRWRSLGGAIEALRLDCPGRVRMQFAILSLGKTTVVRAIAVVALIMLAQTVAFDLAQIETVSNATRISVSLGRMQEAWLIASPVLLIALCASLWFASRFAVSRSSGEITRPPRSMNQSRSARLCRTMLVLLPLAVGVLLPTLLLGGSLRDLSAVEQFVQRSGGAIMSTLWNAAMVGGLGLCLGIAMTIALRLTPRVARVCAGAFAMLALIPGVLLGAAIAHAARLEALPEALGDSPLPLLVAHLGRFGILACLGAVWLRAIEPRELDDLAKLRGPGYRGWLRADLPRHLVGLLGFAFMIAALSIHEIETSVLLQPVGTDALARFMLELLHYQRRDDLAGGVLVISGLSVLVAVAGGILASPWLKPNRDGSRLIP